MMDDYGIWPVFHLMYFFPVKREVIADNLNVPNHSVYLKKINYVLLFHLVQLGMCFFLLSVIEGR